MNSIDSRQPNHLVLSIEVDASVQQDINECLAGCRK
jgi:hypothetical protein